MRENIYKMIQKAEPGDSVSKLYDIFIVAVAFISVTPLMFKESYPILELLDLVTVYILFADYIFHWMTCDYAGETKGPFAFIKYPFTPFAILDLVSLLPSMGLVSPGLRVLRIFRVSKALQYSNNFQYIARVVKREKKPLISVLYLALFYIFISALTMFTYEPDTFDSFFDAICWATTTLTTVGYSDIYPASVIGKVFSIVSSLCGIAVIALPAGIVTAGFVEELHSGSKRSGHAAAHDPRKTMRDKILTPSFVRYAIIIFAGVAMDIALPVVSRFFDLPVWLDVTGTAFAALVLGPAAGLIAGLINNFFIAAVQYGSSSLFYYAISAAVALIAGLCVKKNGRITLGKAIRAMLLIIAVSAVLSMGIDSWITWGQAPTTRWERFYYDAAFALGVPHALSCLWGASVVKFYDTIASGALVALFYSILPPKYKALNIMEAANL